MKKNGFTLQALVQALVKIFLVAIFVAALVMTIFYVAAEEPAGKQKGPAYRITTLWEDKEFGRAEFYVEGLVGDPNTGDISCYISCLSQAVRKIKGDGYDVTVIPAEYPHGRCTLKSVWVIAERKK